MKVQYRVHKSVPLDHILSQIIQSTSSHPIYLRTISILSSHLCLVLPSGLIPSGFPHACYHLTFLDSVTFLASPLSVLCFLCMICTKWKYVGLLCLSVHLHISTQELLSRYLWNSVCKLCHCRLHQIRLFHFNTIDNNNMANMWDGSNTSNFCWSKFCRSLFLHMSHL
jgi:hypothetical protein